MRFRNRKEAGRLLAKALEKNKGNETVIFALPRGGVVLGVEIAKHLKAPLDLVIPRKIGHPMFDEFAICAVTEDGHVICNQTEAVRVDQQWLDEAAKKEQAEAKRRRQAYLGGRQPVSAKDKTAIIVDDGIATGLTMLAAIQEIKDRQPKRIIVAVPVVPTDALPLLEKRVDRVIALESDDDYLGSVGAYYDDFAQVEDKGVIALLRQLWLSGESRVEKTSS